MSDSLCSYGRVSYENTVRALIHTDRASYRDLAYLPVFRASGLFYVVVDKQRTTYVVFLNYWREKNDNTAVGALVSLRDKSGKLCARFHFQVELTAYQINAREVVEECLGAGAEFEGSLEIEFHSDKDLKFAFPALYVCYETPHGLSYVHTNQRTYNNVEDQRRGDPFNPAQTGFDVFCRGGTRPFVFVINGPNRVDADASVLIYNAAGEERRHEMELGSLAPYEALKLELADLPGVRNFLGDDEGFIKLDLPLGGVFNRFASGVEVADGKWLGITHSYFDCSNHADYYDTTPLIDHQFPCFVPVNLVDGLETEIVLYPILAPSKLLMRIDCFDEAGRLRASIDLPGPMDGSGRHQVRVDLRSALREAGERATAGLYVLHIDAKDGRLPTRVTFGLNYRVGQIMGCNISSSVLMAPSYATRARAWLWGLVACRRGARNVIMLSHFSKIRGDERPAVVELSLYGAQGKICTGRYRMANATGLNIDPEAMLAKAGYLFDETEFVWYVAKSENPALIANQIHISASGYVGGDHSF